jgi:hypothetical protein
MEGVDHSDIVASYCREKKVERGFRLESGEFKMTYHETISVREPARFGRRVQYWLEGIRV